MSYVLLNKTLPTCHTHYGCLKSFMPSYLTRLHKDQPDKTNYGSFILNKNHLLMKSISFSLLTQFQNAYPFSLSQILSLDFVSIFTSSFIISFSFHTQFKNADSFSLCQIPNPDFVSISTSSFIIRRRRTSERHFFIEPPSFLTSINEF